MSTLFPKGIIDLLVGRGFKQKDAERMVAGYDDDAAYFYPQYHSTPESFTEIDPSLIDLGLHSGTKEQAVNRAKTVAAQRAGTFNTPKEFPEDFNLLELAVLSRNPLRVSEDAGAWDDPAAAAGALVFEKPLIGRKDEIESIYERASELDLNPDKEFIAAQRRSMLDELSDIVREQGYDSIIYPNAVENAFGDMAGWTEDAEKKISKLRKEIEGIKDAGLKRRPPPPNPRDPDVTAKLDEFLSFGDGLTDAERIRITDLTKQFNKVMNDPASRHDNTSMISLNPEQVKFTDAEFSPFGRSSRNMKLGVTGLGTGGLLSAIPNDAMAMESYAEPVEPVSVGQYAGGVMNALMQVFGPDIQGNIGDGTLYGNEYR